MFFVQIKTWTFLLQRIEKDNWSLRLPEQDILMVPRKVRPRCVNRTWRTTEAGMHFWCRYVKSLFIIEIINKNHKKMKKIFFFIL